MTLSGWTRLWIAGAALLGVGCSQASTADRDRLVLLEAACKQFVENAGWWNRDPLAEGTPERVRDDMAIRQMLEACEKSWPKPP